MLFLLAIISASGGVIAATIAGLAIPRILELHTVGKLPGSESQPCLANVSRARHTKIRLAHAEQRALAA